MLLEEDPATLIRTTVANFNIAADRAAVSRVGDSLATLQQARDGHVRDASGALRRLARQRESLASRHDELVASARGASQHAADMARLDRHKFRVAKAASDLEMETERLQGQAQDLAARLQELELQGVDGGGDGGPGSGGAGGGEGGEENGGGGTAAGTVDDEVLLRLKVYRSLGIDLERDGEEGEFKRAVVRNDRKGDVHVVNIDRKFSRFFYANYFWQTL